LSVMRGVVKPDSVVMVVIGFNWLIEGIGIDKGFSPWSGSIFNYGAVGSPALDWLHRGPGGMGLSLMVLLFSLR